MFAAVPAVSLFVYVSSCPHTIISILLANLANLPYLGEPYHLFFDEGKRKPYYQAFPTEIRAEEKREERDAERKFYVSKCISGRFTSPQSGTAQPQSQRSPPPPPPPLQCESPQKMLVKDRSAPALLQRLLANRISTKNFCWPCPHGHAVRVYRLVGSLTATF